MQRLKLITCLACVSLAFSMLGCSTNTTTTETSTSESVATGAVFEGTIIEVGENEIIVRPDDDSTEINTSDQFSIPLTQVDSSAALAVGDSVRIEYSGVIEELYPAQLKDITSVLVTHNENELSIIETYEKNSDEDAEEESDYTIFETFYKMSDETYQTEDGISYKYLLKIAGENSAGTYVTYLYLSNIESISFDQAAMASGLSSNTEDYFDKTDARFVGMR